MKNEESSRQKILVQMAQNSIHRNIYKGTLSTPSSRPQSASAVAGSRQRPCRPASAVSRRPRSAMPSSSKNRIRSKKSAAKLEENQCAKRAGPPTSMTQQMPPEASQTATASDKIESLDNQRMPEGSCADNSAGFTTETNPELTEPSQGVDIDHIKLENKISETDEKGCIKSHAAAPRRPRRPVSAPAHRQGRKVSKHRLEKRSKTSRKKATTKHKSNRPEWQ